MFTDVKNINVRLVVWLLVAACVRPLHYLFYHFDLDVMHLNKVFTFHYGNLDMQVRVKDLFLLYDAPKGVKFDIAYYLYELSLNLIIIILSYTNYFQYKFIRSIAEKAPKNVVIYWQSFNIVKIFLLLMTYYCLSYILYKGQFLHGVPLGLFLIAVSFVLYFRQVRYAFHLLKYLTRKYVDAAKNKIVQLWNKNGSNTEGRG